MMSKYTVNFFDKINLKIKKNNILDESFRKKINSERTRRANRREQRMAMAGERKGLTHESARSDCQTN